jgi:hypothetical protein
MDVRTSVQYAAKMLPALYSDSTPPPPGLAKLLRTIERRQARALEKLKRKPTRHDHGRMEDAAQKRYRKNRHRLLNHIECVSRNYCLDDREIFAMIPFNQL